MAQYNAFLILDGLILVDFAPGEFRIIIPDTHGHAHQVVTDPAAGIAGRRDIPASRNYTVTGLAASPNASPFPTNFDLRHLVFDQARLAVRPPGTGDNPHAIISVPRLPDAIYGFQRYEVSSHLILRGTDPNILRGGVRDKIVFTELVVFAFEQTVGTVQMAARVPNGTFDAVAVQGKQHLTLVSRPNVQHPGLHAQALNEILAIGPKGAIPDLGLTGIPAPPHPDVRQIDDDIDPAAIGLSIPVAQLGMTIRTGGCGFTAVRG